MMADEFFHDYDAIKRREYYLKTRKLKGRKPGAAKPTAAKPHKSQEQRRKERQHQLEVKVAELKGRLEKLQKVLKTLTEQAKARSGVKSTTSSTSSQSSTSKTSSSSTSSKDKPLTAAQKAAEAEAQAKYYKKTKNQQLSDEVTSLTEKLKTIKERIAKMRKSGELKTQTKS